MKQFLIISLIFISSVAFSYPRDGEISNPNGSTWGYELASEVWRPVQITASGVVKVEGTVTASGSSLVTISSETIGLITKLSSILSSLASDAVGLKTNTTISTDSIGLVAAIQKLGPISSGSWTYTTSLPAAASVAAYPGRNVIAFFQLGTETVYVTPFSTTATVSQGIPIYQNGYRVFEFTDAVNVAHVCSTSAPIGIFQGVRP